VGGDVLTIDRLVAVAVAELAAASARTIPAALGEAACRS
jgi:hypothetical protein